MSAYWVGKLCYDANRNPALLDDFRKDPETVMGRYHFSEEEKERMRQRDLPYFYRLGVNPYLIGRLGSFMEMDRPAYRQAILEAGAHPFLPTVSFPGPAKGGKYLVREQDLAARAR